MNGLEKWAKTATRGASARAIARRMDRSPDTVSRWMKQGKMPTDAIFQFARIYHADVVQGMILSRIATAEDIEDAMPQLLHHASLVQLTAEVHRRAVGRISRTVAS